MSCVHGLEELILLKYPYTQSNLQIQCNLNQITHGIFIELEKIILKFVWNHRRPQQPKQF